MAIKHAFTSAVDDGDDDTLVQPSDWNADHTDAASSAGWTMLPGTISYVSADDPTYVVSADTDVTTVVSEGMRMKWTQGTTVGYGIITDIGSYSSGTVPVTVYGGTAYDIGTATIGSAYYSPHKAPFGFPTNPSYWTVSLIDTSKREQTNVSSTTWYNLGSLSINIPIGCWDTSYQLALRNSITSGTQLDMKATMSTSGTTPTDSELTAMANIQYTHAASNFIEILSVTRHKYITLDSKTTYYLLATSSIATSDIAFRGDLLATSVLCVSSYL